MPVVRLEAGNRRLVADMFTPGLREKIPIEMIAQAYDDPDDRRDSEQDELREVRVRWFADEGVAVVVDTDDGRVVTVWRRGAKR